MGAFRDYFQSPIWLDVDRVASASEQLLSFQTSQNVHGIHVLLICKSFPLYKDVVLIISVCQANRQIHLCTHILSSILNCRLTLELFRSENNIIAWAHNIPSYSYIGCSSFFRDLVLFTPIVVA